MADFKLPVTIEKKEVRLLLIHAVPAVLRLIPAVTKYRPDLQWIAESLGEEFLERWSRFQIFALSIFCTGGVTGTFESYRIRQVGKKIHRSPLSLKLRKLAVCPISL